MLNIGDGGNTRGTTGADGHTRNSATSLRDVGRDPWFLSALQGESRAPVHDARPGMNPANVSTAASVTPSQTGRTGSPAETCAARGIAAHASDTSVRATPEAVAVPGHAWQAHMRDATAVPAPVVPIAPTSPHATATPSPAPVHDATDAGCAHASAMAAHSADVPWARRHIVLRDTVHGVEILARDYFLDAEGRHTLVQEVLDALAVAGRRPARLILNGELAWFAAAPAGRGSPEVR